MDNIEQDINFDWVDTLFWTLGIIFSLLIILVMLVIYVVKSSKRRAIRDQEAKHLLNSKVVSKTRNK